MGGQSNAPRGARSSASVLFRVLPSLSRNRLTRPRPENCTCRVGSTRGRRRARGRPARPRPPLPGRSCRASTWPRPAREGAPRWARFAPPPGSPARPHCVAPRSSRFARSVPAKVVGGGDGGGSSGAAAAGLAREGARRPRAILPARPSPPAATPWRLHQKALRFLLRLQRRQEMPRRAGCPRAASSSSWAPRRAPRRRCRPSSQSSSGRRRRTPLQ